MRNFSIWDIKYKFLVSKKGDFFHKEVTFKEALINKKIKKNRELIVIYNKYAQKKTAFNKEDVQVVNYVFVNHLLCHCPISNMTFLYDTSSLHQKIFFNPVGFYKGGLIIKDEETSSYWSVLTGECLYGSHQGSFLKRSPLDLYLVETFDYGLSNTSLPIGLIGKKDLIPIHFFKKIFFNFFFNWERNKFIFPFNFLIRDESDDKEDAHNVSFSQQGILVIVDGKTKFYSKTIFTMIGGVLIDRVGDKNLILFQDSRLPNLSHVGIIPDAVNKATYNVGGIQLSNGEIIISHQTITKTHKKNMPHPIYSNIRYGVARYQFPYLELYIPNTKNS